MNNNNETTENQNGGDSIFDIAGEHPSVGEFFSQIGDIIEKGFNAIIKSKDHNQKLKK